MRTSASVWHLNGSFAAGTSMAGSKCNACGGDAADATPLPPFSINRKGKKVSAPWFSCKVCGSCFCVIDSTEHDEVFHHRTRRHGVLAHFESYRQLKRPMYRYICTGMAERGLAGGNLLDVGASFGGFLSEARAAGFRSSAVDINPDCVEYLQSNGFTAFQASSLADLDLGKSGFDAITMIDVPYYFKDQAGEFKTARELLKPGGWLVVRTTNKRWAVWISTILAKVRAEWAQKLFARAVVDHAFVQSAGSLRSVLRNCGYREVFIEPDRTHIIQDVAWEAKAAYIFGMILSKIARRPLLVPGVIVWARRP
jgi:2-polyprenyl-3-methyl-5-hydroxy-6-metoxy-1,4-benzoquinol methylase